MHCTKFITASTVAMQIKAQTRKRILSWCGITLLGGIIGVSYSLWVGGNPGLAFTAACILTGAVFGFELFYVYRPAGIWLLYPVSISWTK